MSNIASSTVPNILDVTASERGYFSYLMDANAVFHPENLRQDIIDFDSSMESDSSSLVASWESMTSDQYKEHFVGRLAHIVYWARREKGLLTGYSTSDDIRDLHTYLRDEVSPIGMQLALQDERIQRDELMRQAETPFSSAYVLACLLRVKPNAPTPRGMLHKHLTGASLLPGYLDRLDTGS